ncbi:MAG: hypothetical protein ACM33T_06300 [Solirubrobacterales bacterium]
MTAAIQWVAHALAAGDVDPVAYTCRDGSIGVWCWGDNLSEIALPDGTDLEECGLILSAMGRVYAAAAN